MLRCTPVATDGRLDMSVYTANHNSRCDCGEYRPGQLKYWKRKPVSRSVYGKIGNFFYIILYKYRPCDEAVFLSKGSKKILWPEESVEVDTMKDVLDKNVRV